MLNSQGIVKGDRVNFRLPGGRKSRRVQDIDGNGNVIVSFNSNTRFIIYDKEITGITKGGTTWEDRQQNRSLPERLKRIAKAIRGPQ